MQNWVSFALVVAAVQIRAENVNRVVTQLAGIGVTLMAGLMGMVR